MEMTRLLNSLVNHLLYSTPNSPNWDSLKRYNNGQRAKMIFMRYERNAARPRLQHLAKGDSEEKIKEFVERVRLAFEKFEEKDRLKREAKERRRQAKILKIKQEVEVDEKPSLLLLPLEGGRRLTRLSTGTIAGVDYRKVTRGSVVGPSSSSSGLQVPKDLVEVKEEKFNLALVKDEPVESKSYEYMLRPRVTRVATPTPAAPVAGSSHSKRKPSGNGRKRSSGRHKTEPSSGDTSERNRTSSYRKTEPRRRDRSRASLPVGKVDETSDLWYVEKIVGARIVADLDLAKRPADSKPVIEYLVKWEGWGSEYNNFETEDRIHADLAIKQYWKGVLKETSKLNKFSSKHIYKINAEGSDDDINAVINFHFGS